MVVNYCMRVSQTGFQEFELTLVVWTNIWMGNKRNGEGVKDEAKQQNTKLCSLEMPEPLDHAEEQIKSFLRSSSLRLMGFLQ